MILISKGPCCSSSNWWCHTTTTESGKVIVQYAVHLWFLYMSDFRESSVTLRLWRSIPSIVPGCLGFDPNCDRNGTRLNIFVNLIIAAIWFLFPPASTSQHLSGAGYWYGIYFGSFNQNKILMFLFHVWKFLKVCNNHYITIFYNTAGIFFFSLPNPNELLKCFCLNSPWLIW